MGANELNKMLKAKDTPTLTGIKRGAPATVSTDLPVADVETKTVTNLETSKPKNLETETANRGGRPKSDKATKHATFYCSDITMSKLNGTVSRMYARYDKTITKSDIVRLLLEDMTDEQIIRLIEKAK